VLLGTLALAGPALTAVQLRQMRAPLTLVGQISTMIFGPEAPVGVIGLRDFGVRLHSESNSSDGISRSPLYAFQSREPEVAATETPPPGIVSPHSGTAIGDVANLTYGMSTLAASCKLTAMTRAVADPQQLFALSQLGLRLIADRPQSAIPRLPVALRPTVFANGESEGRLGSVVRDDVPLRLGAADQMVVHDVHQVARTPVVMISSDGSVDGLMMTKLFHPDVTMLAGSFEYADAYLWRRAIASRPKAAFPAMNG
jgi:hypothetical protein